MDTKEKDLGFDTGTQKDEYQNESASRARNRTVMLTPEMTSQVRSRFQQESDPPPAAPARQSGMGFEGSRGGGQDNSGSGYYSPGQPARQNEPAPQNNSPAPARALPHNSNEGITWMKESPVVGFLVSYDNNPNGSVFELRTGRLIVTNQPAAENTLLLKDDSVSSMHAIIRVSASGEIQVLDQLSEFGTKIKRFGTDDEDSLSGEKSTVDHGDILSFGSRSFHVCIVPRGN